MKNWLVTLSLSHFWMVTEFKSSHNICELEIQSKKLSDYKEEANKFVTHLADFM